MEVKQSALYKEIEIIAKENAKQEKKERALQGFVDRFVLSTSIIFNTKLVTNKGFHYSRN